jgi:hypothetical protein
LRACAWSYAIWTNAVIAIRSPIAPIADRASAL